MNKKDILKRKIKILEEILKHQNNAVSILKEHQLKNPELEDVELKKNKNTKAYK